MKKVMFNYKVLLVSLIMVNSILGAPRRSPSSTTFDQKQTGEYNIQLHLKDFQIIAVVGDDSFSNFGDYDYSYDYSDFTVKPSTSTTTRKPDADSTELSVGLSTTKKPQNTHPYPIISPSTTPASSSSSIPPSTTQQILELPHKTDQETATQESSNLSVSSSTQLTPTSNIKANATIASTTTTRPTSGVLQPQVLIASSQNIPGQIPVMIQDLSLIRNEKPIVKEAKPHQEKKVDAVTSVTIVPADDSSDSNVSSAVELGEHPALGEILHYKRCAQGYQRDKRGRCRKVRRPQIPLDLTKFATNLAARFRQASYNDGLEATDKEAP